MPVATEARQQRLDDLGVPLREITFVVVDLETTGGSHEHSRITEFGAVKVRGGEMLGELQTLVNPGVPIPPGITLLTGINAALVAACPPVEAVLPCFLEFCRGATLVAHNASFDVGFLNANLERLCYPRLQNPAVCTAALARRLVREEVRDCKLATLAQFFRCRSRPTHRALADARATVEVLHGLLERAGSFGVMTLEDLLEFAHVRNAPLYKARRHLAEGLPHQPGVYAFRSASGEVLYVGKATDLQNRVRSYFGSDTRRKIIDMMKETAAVDHWVCPTPIEAAVREVRLIQASRPRFNRRSKHPDRAVWLKLTAERFPRLSVVKGRRDDSAAYLGPLPSRRMAEHVAAAIHDAVPIRRCTDRIGRSTRFAPCSLADMGRCLAPCDGRVGVEVYERAAATVARAFAGDPSPIAERLFERMERLAGQGRFEEAAAVRDRLAALVSVVRRARRSEALRTCPTIVASRARAGTCEVVLVRGGRLATSAACPPSALEQTVAALAALPGPRDEAPAGADEMDLVARWLEGARVTVHRCDGVFASPVAGGAVLERLEARLRDARRGTAHPASELAAKRTRRASETPDDTHSLGWRRHLPEERP